MCVRPLRVTIRAFQGVAPCKGLCKEESNTIRTGDECMHYEERWENLEPRGEGGQEKVLPARDRRIFDPNGQRKVIIEALRGMTAASAIVQRKGVRRRRLGRGSCDIW
jgi:hypothetical protein